MVGQSSPNHRSGALSDEEALTQMKKGHETMCVMLSSRLKNLQTVRGVWTRDGIKVRLTHRYQQLARVCVKVMTVWRSSARIQPGSSFMQLLLLLFCFQFVCVNKIIFKLLFVCVQIALDTAVSMSDPSIVVDILNIINPQP